MQPENAATSRWISAALVGATSFGLLGLALIPGSSWVEFFAHPSRTPVPDVTRQGANLWRVMLVASAVMTPLAFLALRRLSEARSCIPALESRPAARRERWVLPGLIALGFALRAARLGEGLWYDEVAMWGTYVQHGPGVVVGNYFDPSNHVAYGVLLWASLAVFGDSLPLEWAFRLPALLFSLATIPAMWALVREVARPRAAILAAGLAAVLPVIVLEGVEARGYGMMIFFSAASTWALLRAARVGVSGWWLFYALLAAMGVWTHVVTAFVPLGHAAWLVMRRLGGSSWCETFQGGAAIALAGLWAITLHAPLLPDFLRLMTEQSAFARSAEDQPSLFGPEGLHALLQLGGAWAWWAALPGLILLGLGMIAAAGDRSARSLAAAAGLGLPLMILVVLVSGSWVYARFMLFAMPSAMVLIALGLDFLARRGASAFGLGVAIVLGVSIADLATRPPKQPMREAVSHVAARHRPGDRVLAIDLFHEPIRVYLLNLLTDAPTQVTAHGRDDFNIMLRSTSPDWVIVTYPHLLTPERTELLRSLGYGMDLSLPGWADWGRGEVRVYRLDR